MEKFEALSSIKDTLIPILWFEEGIDELGDQPNYYIWGSSFWLYDVYFGRRHNIKMQFSL